MNDPDFLRSSSFEIKVGATGKSPEDYAALLIEMDYDNEYQVNLPGEFARRGGILDVFSPLHNEAHRIEFFDDEVESIRAFDSQTLRSFKDVGSIKIVPRAGKSSETGSLMDYCSGFTVLLLNDRVIESKFSSYLGRGGWVSLKKN